jgi:hypothetical protein
LVPPAAASVHTTAAIGAVKTAVAAAPATNIRVAVFIFTNMPQELPLGTEVKRCSPDGIRTHATAVRGRRPRPLDDGAMNKIRLVSIADGRRPALIRSGLGYQDSNLEWLNQNQLCCQLHHTPLAAITAGQSHNWAPAGVTGPTCRLPKIPGAPIPPARRPPGCGLAATGSGCGRGRAAPTTQTVAGSPMIPSPPP